MIKGNTITKGDAEHYFTDAFEHMTADQRESLYRVAFMHDTSEYAREKNTQSKDKKALMEKSMSAFLI